MGVLLTGVVADVVADVFGLTAVIYAVAAVTVSSGVLVAMRTYETLSRCAARPRGR